MSLWNIRPIQPQDAPCLRRAIGDRDWVSDESLYRRFHGSKRAFSRKELRYLTEVDGHQHVALVAEVDDRHRIAAIARGVVTEPGVAEVALLVVDSWQGYGLGSAMLRELVVCLHRQGVREIVAIVQPDNLPMQQLLRKLAPNMDVTDHREYRIDVASMLPAYARH